jgi:hypothetical protein
VSDSGKIEQRRFYDENGNAKLDIDLTDHNRPWSHEIPHAHDWVKGKRLEKWRKLNGQEKEMIKDVWSDDKT